MSGGAREALNWTEPAETKGSWTGPAETKVSREQVTRSRGVQSITLFLLTNSGNTEDKQYRTPDTGKTKA